LISVFILWSFLRARGLTAQVHQPLKHPFLQIPAATSQVKAPDIVAIHALGDHGLKGSSLERFSQLASQSERLVFWLDIAPDKDGVMIVVEPRVDGENPLRLTEVLKKLANHRLILNFYGYQPGMLASVASALEETKAYERALIQSPEDGFLKDLREAQPLWLFGSSQAQVTRLIMLSAIGMEATAPLKGDVFVMEAESATLPLEHELARLNDSMIREIHRRGMKIYAGPVESRQIDELYHRGVDGVLTAQPEEYLSRATVGVAHEPRTH
jgi:hypothetical protein